MNLNFAIPRSRQAIYIENTDNRMQALEAMFEDLERQPGPDFRRFGADEVKLWKFIRSLGDGASGCVELMRDQTGNCYAVKRMRLTNRSEANRQILRDLEFMLKAVSDRHVDWIVKFHGYVKRTFEAWIVMEVMDTCFGKLLLKEKQIPEDIIGAMAATVVQALHHLKLNHNMMHRDVRPTNILVDREGNIKLCDFGISRVLVNSMAHTVDAGHKYYLAPERVFGGRDRYGIKSDVWSLGITLIELATGINPYADCEGEFAAGNKICSGPIPTLPSSFSPEAREFVSKCLKRKEEKRPNYTEMMSLPFIQRYMSYDKQIVGNWVASVLAE